MVFNLNLNLEEIICKLAKAMTPKDFKFNERALLLILSIHVVQGTRLENQDFE